MSTRLYESENLIKILLLSIYIRASSNKTIQKLSNNTIRLDAFEYLCIEYFAVEFWRQKLEGAIT